MVRKYRPSNGTEGDIFMSAFCFQCKKHSDERPCPILGRVMGNGVDDANYPEEWQYDECNDPTCTAFVHEEDEDKPTRCEATIDMFGAAANG